MLEGIAQIIRGKSDLKPKTAIILGSGLGRIAESVESPTVIPYRQLPGWPESTAPGHSGRLIIGLLKDQPVIAMQGRAHFYEGYRTEEIALPIRVLKNLGVEILIVTNAAGAINPDFLPGDLMLITDHISLMSGQNPLIGKNNEMIGPRFPDMTQAYDRELAAIARKVAVENCIALREGVYVGLSGPSFETPAELRFLRVIGGDAVGMSTVPEVIVARHCGLRVLGLSGISNKSNFDGNSPTSLEEVLEAGKLLAPKIEKLLQSVLHSKYYQRSFKVN